MLTRVRSLTAMLAFSILGSTTAVAQEDSPWHPTLKAAQAAAERSGKDVLVVLVGTSWSGWCRKFDREVLKREAFLETVVEQFELVRMEHPKGSPREPTSELDRERLEIEHRFQVKEFPTILLLGFDGTNLGSVKRKSDSPEQFVEKLFKLVGDNGSKFGLQGREPGSSGAFVNRISGFDVYAYSSRFIPGK